VQSVRAFPVEKTLKKQLFFYYIASSDLQARQVHSGKSNCVLKRWQE
jgi:hypothetical protein